MENKTSLKTRLLTLIIALTLVMGAAMAAGTETASAASKFKVTPGSKTIYVGSKVTLRANKKVKWSVAGKKTNVKIVSKTKRKAIIKGVKAGTVYVKAKAGKKTKKIKIIVKNKPKKTASNAPTALTLVSTQDTIGVDESCAVYINSVEPASANSDVTFSSSDTAIATVDNLGYVNGISPGFVTIKATSKANSKVTASCTIRVIGTYKGTVTMKIDMTDADKYPAGKAAQVWLPVPQSDDSQNISKSTVYWKAKTATKAELNKDSADNKVLYLMWDESVDPSKRTAELSFHCSRHEVVVPDDIASMEQGSIDTSKFAAYLKETKRSGSLTSGIVKETAEKAVKEADANTVYEKAQAIYNWVCDNLRANVKTRGLGFSNVPYILENRDEIVCGSADVSAVFVALCRAEGIPARNIYGMHLVSLASYSYKPNCQSCRSQFYLPGYGWANADATSALDVVFANEDLYRGAGAKYEAKWTSLKEKNWIAVPASWVTMSTGEDIELSPRQTATSAEDAATGDADALGMLNEDGTLCYFGFPYAEYDSQYLRCYNLTSKDKSELNYSYSFLADVDDCGCE